MPEDRISQIRERYRESQKAGTPDIETPDIKTPDIKTPVTQDTNRISLIRERYQQMGMDSRPDNDQGSRPDNDQGWITNLSSGVEAGYDQMRGGLKYFAGDVVDWFDGEQPGTGDRWKREAASILENAPQGDGFWYDFGSFLPQTIGSLAAVLATPFTGGTSLAAIPAIIGTANIATIAGMSVGSSLHEYDQYTEEMGLETSEMVRLGTGLLNGAIEYAAEKIRLGRFLPKGGLVKEMTAKMVAKNPSLSKNILHKFAQQSPTGYRKYIKAGAYMLNQGKEEGLEELFTETAQSFVNMAYKGEDAWDDFGERAWKSFRGGAMMGIGIGTAGVWATNKTNTTRRKKHGVTLAEYVREKESMMDFVKAPDGSRPLESGVVEIAGTTKNGNYIGITPKGKQIELLPDQISKSITMSNDDFEAYNNALGENHAKAKEILDDVYVKDMTARIDGTVDEMEYFGGQDNAGNGKYFAASDEKGQAIGFVISGGLDTQTDGLSYLIVSDGQGGVKKDQIKSSKIHTIEEISRESIVNYLMTNAGIEKQNMDAQQKAQEAVEDEEVLTNDRVKTKHGNGVVTKMSEVGAVVQLDNGEEKIIPVEELEILRDGIDAEEESVIMKQGRPTDKGVEATSDRKINNEPSQTVQISAKKSVNVYPNEDGTQTIGEGYKDIDEAKAVVNALKKVRPNLDKNGFEIINLNQGGDEWAAPEYVIRYSPKTLKDVQVKPTSELEDNKKTGSKESAIGDTRADDGKAGGEDVKTGELKTEVTPGDGVSAIQTGGEKPATGGESNRAGEEIKSNSREQIKGVIARRKAEQEEADRKREAEANAKKKANKGKTKLEIMNEAKDAKTLDVKLNYNGVIQTRREHVVAVINDGGHTETAEVNKVKDVSRTAYNRMDGRQQENLERRIKEGGKKTEYRLYTKDGTFYDITKAEYDYAQTLENQLPEARKKVKQPWEMTREEFDKSEMYSEEVTGNFTEEQAQVLNNDLSNPWIYTKYGGRPKRFKSHKKSVQQALSEGKIIPENVKKDYPELFEVKESLPVETPVSEDKKVVAPTKPQGVKDTPKPQEKQRPAGEVLSELTDKKTPKVSGKDNKLSTESAAKVDTPELSKKAQKMLNELQQGKPFNKVLEENELTEKEQIQLAKLFAESDKFPSKQYSKKDKIGGYNIFDSKADYDVKPIEKKVTLIKDNLTKTKVESLTTIVVKDEMRPAMEGVFKDKENNKVIATDAHKMIVIDDNKIDKTEIVNPKTGKVIEGKYPAYNSVIPLDNPLKRTVNVNEWLAQLNGLVNTKRFFSNPLGVRIIIGDNTYYFNSELMQSVFQVFAKYGVENVELQFSDPTRALVVESNKGIMGLVMPIMGNADSKASELFGYKTMAEWEYTSKEKTALLENEIKRLETRKLDKESKLQEAKKELISVKRNSTNASKIKSAQWAVEFAEQSVSETIAEIEGVRKRIKAIENPLQESLDIETVKENIENGTITKEQATEFIERPVEQPTEVEQSITDIEGKAESDNEAELNEVVNQADEFIKSGQIVSKQSKSTEGGVSTLEEKKITQVTGIKPKNLRDTYRAGREIFGLNRSQALAQAIVVNTVVNKIAKNRGVTAEKVWGEIEFRKGMVNGKDALYQQAKAETFYSPTEKALTKIQQNKGKTEQFKAMLLKNGAKQAEMDWMDYDGTFTGKSVTKTEIQDWIDQNRIEVEEVQKGGFEWKGNDLIVGGEVVANLIHNEDGTWSYQSDFSEGEEAWETKLDAQKEAEEAIIGDAYSPNATKYSQYQLPGGENYKELLLTMPRREKPFDKKISLDNGKYYIDGLIIPFNTEAEAIEYNNRVYGGQIDKNSGNFKSSHFDEPNILAHVRFNERTVNGEKVLFIEEIQSDWAQEGKKKGYGTPKYTIKDVTIAENGLSKVGNDNNSQNYFIRQRRNVFDVESTSGINVAEFDNIEKAKIFVVEKENQRQEQLKHGVPNMPFKKTDQWVNLALRRMMMYAAENDYDRISWTTGEQQADRYDLSKQVDEITYRKDDKGKYDIGVYKNGELLVARNHQTESDVENIIGKELAKKVVNDEATTKNGKVGFISGLDLKVGGEGMKTFYDAIVPNAAKELGKKFGARVEPIELQSTKTGIESQDKVLRFRDWVWKNKTDEFTYKDAEVGITDNSELYKEYLNNLDLVLSMSITESMKESALKDGMPLFQKQGTGKTAKGAIQFLADGNAIISALTDPNVSTPLHEIAHLYERYMPDSERKAVLKWAKHKTWSTETSEMFARGFEKYLATGKAPLPSLVGVFRRFKAWLTDIYNGITGSEIDIQLNDAMTDIYSAMLGADVVQKTTKNKNKVEKPVSEDKKEQPVEKIEDFGEKIEGAKKDIYQRMKDVTHNDIISLPLSKTFPRPDFVQLVKDGTLSEDGATILKFVYEQIPSKPRKKYKLASWARVVQDAIDTYSDFLQTEGMDQKWITRLKESDKYKYLWSKYEHFREVQKALGFPKEDINTGAYEIKSFVNSEGGKVSIVKSPHIISHHENIQEAADALKAMLVQNKTKSKGVKLDLYQDTKTKKYFIGRKTATGTFRLVDGIETLKEGRDKLKNEQAQLQELWDNLKIKPNERRDKNRDRVGTDYRKGKDVTPEEFGDTFGFRGVQFGNWVKGNERQESLNDAYDALMDLSTVLKISPRALSLGGELGMAFGARGSGKFSAHYESGQVVINLTKTKGAGSLAHEWWHAIDSYFSRTRGNKGGFLTESPRQKMNVVGNQVVPDESLRDELIAAFKGVVDVIRKSEIPTRSKKLDSTRSDLYWSTIIEMSARSFENFIIEKLGATNEQNDYLANFKEMGEWIKSGNLSPENYPYPTKDETGKINEAFQQLFDTIQEKTDEEGNSVLFAKAYNEAERVPPKVIDRIFEGEQVSRKPKETTFEYAKRLFRQAKKNAPNAPEVVVVKKIEDLKGVLSDKALATVKNFDTAHGTPAFYVNGKMYVIAENIKGFNSNFAAKLWLHEVGVHHGLNILFNETQKQETLQKIADFAGRDNMLAFIEKETNNKGLTGYENLGDTELAEEYLAYLSKKMDDPSKVTAKERSVWAKIVEWIRSKVKNFLGHNISNKDVMDIVKSAVQANYTDSSITGITSDGVRFQIAGESGAANLDKAEEATTRLDNLRVAMEMEAAVQENNDTSYKFDNDNADYFIRFSNNIEDDLKRGWSSWNFGGDGFSGTQEELLDYINDYNNEDGGEIGISGFNIWVDESSDISTYNGVVYLNGYEFRELYDDYWVAVDRINAPDGLSAHLLPDNLDNTRDALRLIEIEKTKYDGTGDGQSFDSENAKIIYTGNIDGKEFHLVEIGENKEKQPSKPKSFTPQQIKLATGWERGADGKWRYEVPDGKNYNDISTLKTKEYNGSTYKVDKLPSLVDDPELFKAYPELKDVQVVLYNFNADGKNAEYRQASKIITDFPASITVWGVDYSNPQLSDSKKSSLRHEIQHAIQDIENFATGGNEDYVRLKKLSPDNPLWDKWNSEENQKAIDEYAELYDSPEYKAQLNESNKLFTEKFEPRIDELDRKFDSYEGDWKVLSKEISSKKADIFAEWDEMYKDIFPLLYKLDEIAKSSIIREPERKISNFDTYKRLAGEVEARNVQNRINMSEEDRRRTPLKETEDTPRKDQIIYEGDDVKFMANQTGDPNFDSRHEPIIKGAYENSLEIFHDNMRSVKTLQELITKRGGVMGEDLDTHLFENLTSSISKAEIEKFEHSIQRMFLGAVKHIAGRYGIDADGIGIYLMAKHASERNKVMQMQGFKLEEGSGMSDVEAEAYIREFEGKVDQADIKALLDSRSEVTGFTLRTLNEKGLITNDQYRKYKNQYTDYVPLRGWAGETASDIYKYIEDDINRDAPPMKHAKGRTSLADNPLPYMLSMAHAAIIMGNKNVMRTKALNMVRANSQMQDLFSENPVYEVKQDDGTTITTVNRPDQELFDQKKVTVIKDTRNLYKNTIHNASQHDVIVYDNGEKKVISFTDPVVARAINGENIMAKDFVRKVLSPTVGRVQRFISANFTSKNPAFVPVNWTRDFGYAYFSHFVKGDKGDAEYFRKSMMNSFKAVSRHLRHNLGTTFSEQAINDAQIKISNGESLTNADYDALYYSFKMNGGETGYVHLKNIKNFKNDIEKELRLAVGNPTRWEAANNYAPIKKAGEWMEYMAQMSENQARFSTYLVSMSKGKSHAQSASDAKNITVNFNRRGKVSGLMGNLYLFFNANVQGVANIGKLAKDHPKAFAKLGAGFMTMGFLSALLTRMWADDDDDENAFDKIPTYIKYNFWVLPNPAYYLGYGEKKEKFLTIPLPHGFRAVYALGVMAYEAATGTKGAGDVAIDLVTNTADSFSPISSLNPDEMLKGDITLRPIVPSWMMPFYDINVNRDFAGRMVYKEPFTKALEKKIPGSEQSLPNVNPLLKNAARGLNRLGGGDLNRTAAIGFNPKTTKVDAERNEWKWLIYDWNPSKAEHLLEYYLGGKGKFFNNIYKTTRDATLSVINKENQMNEYTTPILRRFIYTPYTKDTPDKYWELKNEISTWKGLYNDAKSNKDIEMMGRFQKNRRMMELINEFDRSEKRIKDMNERIDRSINPEMKKKLIKDRRMIIKDFLNKSKEIDKRHENSNR